MGFLWSLVFPTLFLFLFSLLFSSSTIVKAHQCHGTESNALLQFKESFVITKSASYNQVSYPKTVSWMPSIDCCSWDGIECHELTGHVIGINLSSSQLYGSIDANSSLFSLVHLQSLDLSDNNFNHSQIPTMIGNFSQLRYLNTVSYPL
ncbi:Receptor-like protein [Arachis hypogaea]|nr:Receptor-like protein [Arachis hypogaea]